MKELPPLLTSQQLAPLLGKSEHGVRAMLRLGDSMAEAVLVRLLDDATSAPGAGSGREAHDAASE